MVGLVMTRSLGPNHHRDRHRLLFEDLLRRAVLPGGVLTANKTNNRYRALGQGADERIAHVVRLGFYLPEL